MLFLQILQEMKSQICEKLRQKPWKSYVRNYVATSIPKKPGIYEIGFTSRHKGSKKTISLYAGETNNLKRRSREHLSRKRQVIDVAKATLSHTGI